MHPFIHIIIHPYIHEFILPYIHASIHPYFHASIFPYIHSFIHPYIHSSINLIIDLSIHHLFNHLFSIKVHFFRLKVFSKVKYKHYYAHSIKFLNPTNNYKSQKDINLFSSAKFSSPIIVKRISLLLLQFSSNFKDFEDFNTEPSSLWVSVVQ